MAGLYAGPRGAYPPAILNPFAPNEDLTTSNNAKAGGLAAAERQPSGMLIARGVAARLTRIFEMGHNVRSDTKSGGAAAASQAII